MSRTTTRTPEFRLAFGYPTRVSTTVVAIGAGALTASLYLTQPTPPQPAEALLPPSVEVALAGPAPLPAPKPAVAPPAPLALARSSRPQFRQQIPAAVTAKAPIEVTQGTRNVEFLWVKPERGGVPELRLAELTTARARMTDAPQLAPMPRPAAAALIAPVARSEESLRPKPRPGAKTPAIAVAVSLPPIASFGRPLPRPDGPSVKVASLGPDTAAIAGLAVASTGVAATPPPARPDDLAPAKAKRIAAPAPKVTVVKPKPVSIAAIQRGPTATAPVSPPAPQRVVTAAPQRAVVAAAVPQTARPTAASPATQATQPTMAFAGPVRSGISRGNVSLIGVFGDSDGRHALLRLPNGQIERVKAGDSIQGIQVAAVGEDSVQISGRGRSTLLRLPD